MRPSWAVRAAWTAFAVFLLALLSLPLWAAPRAESPQECTLLADFGVIAATHAKHGITREATMEMAKDIYVLTPGVARGPELMDLVARAAYTFIQQKQGTPGDFATLLFRVCNMSGGNLDPVLGVRM